MELPGSRMQSELYLGPCLRAWAENGLAFEIVAWARGQPRVFAIDSNYN